MSDVTNSTINQVYNLVDDDKQQGQVTRVILLFMPHSFMAAGFDINGGLVTVRSSEYAENTPWILDFYENQFLHNPLLTNTRKVIAAFIANEQSMIVPSQLYDEDVAISWLKSLYFIESSENVASYPIQVENAYYLSAWPGSIKSLINRYFPARKIMPLAYYQFKKQDEVQDLVECCILKDEVAATLYKDGKLFWHQIFKYKNTEDIAYHINMLLKLHHLDREKVEIRVTATNPDLTETVNYLTQYFPHLREGGEDKSVNRNWMSTVYLLQQLYKCAL